MKGQCKYKDSQGFCKLLGPGDFDKKCRDDDFEGCDDYEESED